MNIRFGIAAPRCGSDIFGIRPLVVRRRADDGVEGGCQRADDFVRLLVARNAGDGNPAVAAMDRLKACQRLPDAVGGMADVDYGERVVLNDLEPAGPARIAQTGAYRGLDSFGRLAGPLTLQPHQK